MQRTLTYDFDWDAEKESANQRKHGIDFQDVVSIFHDPLALTRFDREHSETEERWITLGRTDNTVIVLVAHTFEYLAENHVKVRIFSARRATAGERFLFEHNQYSVQEDHSMQDEYDFSNAERGKFYSKNVIFRIPVRLRPEVLAFFTAQAARRGIPVDDLLNEVLSAEMERLKAAS